MEQTILIICIFGAVAAAAYWVLSMLTDGGDEKLRERLTSEARMEVITANEEDAARVPLLTRIGQAAAQPFMPTDRERVSALRRSLAMAGIYSPAAFRLVIGAKVICLGVGLMGGYFIGSMFNQVMLGISLGGLLGYLLPIMWLKIQIAKHQKELNYGLPDALDLMVVCIEAGLTIDSAMQRVGQELMLAHPRLSREMEITHMETRVGLARADALRNMATRTGNASVQSLIAMLIQAERFGTSIAKALRVHADSMRVSRQQAAEELAGKASVKLSFPLVLFIFPATFIVLAGPTLIELLNSPMFKD